MKKQNKFQKINIQNLYFKMKWLIVLLLFISTTVNAQISFNPTFGDSEINGLFGANIEVNRFALGGGWRPNYTPLGEQINSWSGSFTVYTNLMESGFPGIMSNFYFSAGYSPNGFIDKKVNAPFPYEYEPVPVTILLVGIRSYVFPKVPNFNCKAGFGINLNESEVVAAFEFIVSYQLFIKKLDNYPW